MVSHYLFIQILHNFNIILELMLRYFFSGEARKKMKRNDGKYNHIKWWVKWTGSGNDIMIYAIIITYDTNYVPILPPTSPNQGLIKLINQYHSWIKVLL